jgi:phosphoserine phosphatase
LEIQKELGAILETSLHKIIVEHKNEALGSFIPRLEDNAARAGTRHGLRGSQAALVSGAVAQIVRKLCEKLDLYRQVNWVVADRVHFTV